jgi:hypothetical protein
LDALREAVVCLAKTVPKSERDMPAVTTTADMLAYAAERGQPERFANVPPLRHPKGRQLMLAFGLWGDKFGSVVPRG